MDLFGKKTVYILRNMFDDIEVKQGILGWDVFKWWGWARMCLKGVGMGGGLRVKVRVGVRGAVRVTP